jgi:phospholipid/cholesterol/gamma-HCH transport system permease protein
MEGLNRGIERVGSTVLLFGESIAHIHTLPRQFGRVLFHCFDIGYRTFLIVGLMSLFIGGVLALQTGFSLKSVSGAQSFLGSIVGLSMCRELGPVITAFLVAGRVGSATTAELASMQVYQEVDALRTMNLSPERILVLPRLIAIALMMPALTISSIIIGWFGGMMVGEYVGFISLEPEVYWQAVSDFVTFESVKDGLVKAEIFGVVVIAICCNDGLMTRGGPREIGYSVTRAVVGSMMMILLLDYFVTKVTL